MAIAATPTQWVRLDVGPGRSAVPFFRVALPSRWPARVRAWLVGERERARIDSRSGRD